MSHPARAEREDPEDPRFVLHLDEIGENDPLLLATTESWDDVLAALPPLPEPRRFRVYRAEIRYTEIIARSPQEAQRGADEHVRPVERWQLHGVELASLPATDPRNYREVSLAIRSPGAR